MKPPRIRPTETLNNGDQMTREEFHRRYQDYPDETKFELIGGTVYMGSPVRTPHGEFSFELSLVLGLYKAATPGVRGAENTTAILGKRSEPQPDLLLRLTPESGGQATVDPEKYLVGAPEMVVEIAHSTRALDMNKKKDDYLDAGVQEYVVVCVEEKEIHWFHFPSKRKLKADREGVWKSRIFPGLWIDSSGLWECDSSRLIATVQKGIASPEHAEFVRLLAERRARDGSS